MSAKLPTLKTTRFLLFVEVKPCDNCVTEKASTFSRPSPYLWLLDLGSNQGPTD